MRSLPTPRVRRAVLFGVILFQSGAIFAAPSLGEVRVRQFQGQTFVKLVGGDGSAAAELVDLWRKTRATVHRSSKGNEIYNEKDVSAYRWVMGLERDVNRSFFEFLWTEACSQDLTAIPGINHDAIEFSGRVAEDLYRTMVKSGLGIVNISPSESIVSRRWIRCNRVVSGVTEKFFCILTAQPPAPGISRRARDYE